MVPRHIENVLSQIAGLYVTEKFFGFRIHFRVAADREIKDITQQDKIIVPAADGFFKVLEFGRILPGVFRGQRTQGVSQVQVGNDADFHYATSLWIGLD